MTVHGKITTLLFILLLPFLGKAQELSTSVNKNPVGTGERFKFVITLKNGKGKIAPPDLGQFPRVSGPARSSSYRWVNGESMQKISFTYHVVSPKKPGKYTIGKATAKVGGKTLESSTIELEVKEGAGGSGASQAQNSAEARQNKNLFAHIHLNKATAYQGEEIMATVKLYSRYSNLQIAKTNMPSVDGCWTEEIEIKNKGWEDNIKVIDGKRYRLAIVKRMALFPQRAGEITIPPIEYTCVVNRGFFNSGKKIKVKTNTPSIQVEPLPGNPPASFNGAVGKFKMHVGVERHEVKAGNSIDISVQVNGDGNLKLLDEPKLEVPPDIEQYDPKVTSHINKSEFGISGNKTWEYLLVPRTKGTYQIKSPEFTYFDIETEQYRTLEEDPIRIEVLEGEVNATQRTVKAPDKRKVELLEEGPRFIRTENLELKRKDDTFFGSLAFFTGFLGPPAVALILLIFQRRGAKEEDHRSRAKRTRRIARKRLAKAKKALEQGDKPVFHEEVEKALQSYISDAFDIPLSALSKERIRQVMVKQGVRDETISECIKTLEHCEMARYAPKNGVHGEKVYQETVDLLTKLQEEKK